MSDNQLVVQASGCSICLEDCNAAELQFPLTNAERLKHSWGADGESMCMYSVLKDLYDAGDYKKEVVPVNDIVRGTRVPRCWLHRDMYEKWTSFVIAGDTHVCPVCNQGVVMDKNNKVWVYDTDVNESLLVSTPPLLGECGGLNTHCALTPLYITTEAARYQEALLLLSNPRMQIDAMAIVNGKYVTATQCAAVGKHWGLVELFLQHHATYDKAIQHAYFYIHQLPAPSTTPTIQSPTQEDLRQVSSVVALLAEASLWDLKMLDSPSHVGVAGLQCVLQCTSMNTLIFWLAMWNSEWIVVLKMLLIFTQILSYAEMSSNIHALLDENKNLKNVAASLILDVEAETGWLQYNTLATRVNG